MIRQIVFMLLLALQFGALSDPISTATDTGVGFPPSCLPCKG